MIRYILTFLCLALAGGSLRGEDLLPKAKAVRFKLLLPEQFQNFIGGWYDDKFPVLSAVIRTPAQYNLIFNPAPIMGKQPPFAPSDGFFKKSQIVLVARVMNWDGSDKAFGVESVTEKGWRT